MSADPIAPTPAIKSAPTHLAPTLVAAMLGTGWAVTGELAQVSHGTHII